MEMDRLKSLLESLIFVAETPLKSGDMLKAVHALELSEARLAEEAGGEIPAKAVADLETTGGPETEEARAEHQDPAKQLAAYAVEEENRVSKSEIEEALRQLQQEYAENPKRGIGLAEVAEGWQFRTRPDNAAVIRHFYQPKPTRLSKPSLETLSLVAYRQPITRVEIDEIRGVDSGGVLKTLCEKNLVRIVGKKEEPGKPMLYGTTQEFLELFQLKSLKELPGLKDYRDLEEEFRRRSAEEGVVLQVEEEPESEGSLLALSAESSLAPMDAEEEEILEELEENIQEVRQLEREIFTPEKPEEPAEGTAIPTESEDRAPTSES